MTESRLWNSWNENNWLWKFNLFLNEWRQFATNNILGNSLFRMTWKKSSLTNRRRFARHILLIIFIVFYIALKMLHDYNSGSGEELGNAEMIADYTQLENEWILTKRSYNCSCYFYSKYRALRFQKSASQFCAVTGSLINI